MANLVVSGYNFGLPNKHSFILAQWNAKNIQDYAKRCNADCIMINCNSFMDKFKMLSYLNTYDKVLWMDMDLIIHADRFPNLFEYDDNRTFVCKFVNNNYDNYKNSYLKSFCKDEKILSKTNNICSCVMLINQSFLRCIDDDITLVIKEQTKLGCNDEIIWAYIDKKFNDVFNNFNYDVLPISYMNNFSQIADTMYKKYYVIHFTTDFQKHNNDPIVCKFINGFILKNIYTAFNNDNVVDIDANLLLWKDIQSLQK